MPWYEVFGFEADPYMKVDPYTIPDKRIIWNRDDLIRVKKTITDFIEDVKAGYRCALKIYGDWGSGKTWLIRYLEKRIREKVEDVIVIRTYIPKIEPTFSVLYKKFVENVMHSNLLSKIMEALEREGGPTPDGWKKAVGDDDLGQALWNIHHGQDEMLSRRWLLGAKISMRDLSSAGIISRIEGDYRRYEIMEKIIKFAREISSMTVLIIDELENVSPRLAPSLSDALRDLLDAFYDGFALICSYTAASEDEWYDLGYTDALYRRIDYTIAMEPLDITYAPDFLRLHQEVYRQPGFKVEDQLYPFTEDGVKAILTVMDPNRRLPGFILPNCGRIAKEAARQGIDRIDRSFVEKHVELLEELAST